MAINMDVVQDRLLKGVYVGIGSFASTFIEPLIEDNLRLGNLGTAVALEAVGLGMSVGVDEVFNDPRSMPNNAIEFVGYGIQGEAWSNIAEMTQTQTGYSGNSTVTVTSDGGRQTGQNVQVREVDQASRSGGAGAFQAEVG